MGRILFTAGSDLPTPTDGQQTILIRIEKEGEYTRYTRGVWAPPGMTKRTKGIWFFAGDGPAARFSEKMTGWAWVNPPDMERHVKHELAVALAGMSHFTLKDALRFRGFTTQATEEELLTALTEALGSLVEYKPKPRAYGRHEECPDCDQGSHISYEDPEAWYTHCEVCDENWPCPDAGQIDMEDINSDQKAARALRDKTERLDSEEARYQKLVLRLTAAGFPI